VEESTYKDPPEVDLTNPAPSEFIVVDPFCATENIEDVVEDEIKNGLTPPFPTT